MDLDFLLQFQLRNASQILQQDFFLDLELMLVGRVLILAPAALPKMRARRHDAMRRGLQNLDRFSTIKTSFSFGENRLDLFPRQHKGEEYSLAASAIIRRQPSQAIASVDKLFNGEEQVLILRHGLPIGIYSRRRRFRRIAR